MRKLLFKLYSYRFFEDFILIYPLYAVMFTDYGMEPWQVGTLLTSWSLTAFLLEVPSGVWADKYSRKHFFSFGWTAQVGGYQKGFLIFGGIVAKVGMVYW